MGILNDRVVIITGAGGGLGAAHARVFAAEGACVLVNDINQAAAQAVVDEITAAGGWGAAHTKSAREYYARSVAIFEQTGNEVELARTYKVYSRFLTTEPEFSDDDAARAEADQMLARADEIFQRLRISVADRSGPHPAIKE